MRSKFGFWYLIFALLLLAFALRVYRLDFQSIWWDEGHSIEMASAPLSRIPTLPGMDVHPPGYFALLHQWMAVAGRSEYALRYLSVVFSLLTVALMVRFARVLAGQAAGGSRARPASQRGTMVAAGGLAALLPLSVAYAQEVRMYAMVTFFALASVYFQWRVLEVWKVGRLERWKVGWLIVGYILATTASLYTHYFTVFLLVFQNLAWLVWALAPVARGADTLRARATLWLGAQLALLILFLPQLPLALRQTVAYANPNLNPPGEREFISRSWLAYTLGAAVEPALAGPLTWALAVLAALAVLWRLASARRARNGPALGALAFLAGWFLVPLAIYFLVLQRRPSFEPRYLMFVTPALLLLLAWGLPVGHNTLGVGRRIAWRSLAVLLVMTLFAWGTWSYFTRVEAYKDDSAGLVAWLAGETTSDDVVYVDVPHPFHYYAERVPAPVRYLFVDVHTAAARLNAESVGRDRLFWVTWRGSDTDPRGVVPFLLDKAGSRSGERDFRGYHVSWWELPADAHFSLPDDLRPYPVIFGDAVQLDGLAFSDAAQAGDAAWATLHFTLLHPTDVDYRVSVRLRAPGGDRLQSTDKDLLNDRHFRTSAWPLEDARLNQAINVYTLPLPGETGAGDYCLEALVYRADTLEPLPVTGDPGATCPSPSRDGVSAQLGMVAVSS